MEVEINGKYYVVSNKNLKVPKINYTIFEGFWSSYANIIL